MSAGKKPYMRFLIIDKCLSGKQRFWTTEQFIKKFNDQDISVSIRTLMYDLEHMRVDDRLGFHAPIAYCPKRRAYHYTDPEYSIHKLRFTPENMRALCFALNILKQFKGINLAKEFETALDKIFNLVSHFKLAEAENIIAFERMAYNKSLDYIDPVLQAILDEQVISITYEKHTNEKRKYTFHPYFLREYKNRWYIIGHCEERDGVITLGLDRFTGMKTLDTSFIKNTLLKPEEYFKHIIGITNTTGPIEKVELLFSPAQANYIKTQHLHHTQQILRDDKKGLHIRLELRPNYELHSLLLSFGHEVEVLKPLSLRKNMIESVEKIRCVYK